MYGLTKRKKNNSNNKPSSSTGRGGGPSYADDECSYIPKNSRTYETPNGALNTWCTAGVSNCTPCTNSNRNARIAFGLK